MTKRLVWCFTVVTGFGMNSWAQSTDVNLGYQHPRFSTSFENRRPLSYSVEAQLFGSSIETLAGFGVTAGTYIDPDWQIFASYVTSPEEDGYDSNASTSYQNVYIEASMYGVGSKNYLGNSFYLKSGLFVREIGAKAVAHSSFNGERATGELEVTSLGAEIGLGNQWQWDNFTLGCDWIAYYRPLTVLSTSSSTTGTTNQIDLDHVEEIGRVANFNFLRFYLGAAF